MSPRPTDGSTLIMGASGRYEDMIQRNAGDGGRQARSSSSTASTANQTPATNMFSVTKSVMSMLIGIAIGEGLIDGVEQTVGELLPRYVPVMAPGVAAITLPSC